MSHKKRSRNQRWFQKATKERSLYGQIFAYGRTVVNGISSLVVHPSNVIFSISRLRAAGWQRLRQSRQVDTVKKEQKIDRL
jgi:hypothetical protein